ncbi:unnamed protein product, partial [Mesorhabditis belari]|uniref:Uncharacterized protein n=1 Tax=Mesorhabditis belari TaxID=2138241 RepID=A0AAF3E9E7_9BILA
MSVIGFDIGNLNSYIGVARQGGIDVIANDYSLRETPTCVSFGSKCRSMGVSARQQVNTNFLSTIINFKHLLARKFNDPIAQKFIPFVPCRVVELPDGEIGCKVNYLDTEHIFTPEQVLGAFLTKMKTTVEASLDGKTKVYDAVLAVPSYFTDVQRRAVLAAAQTAQLNPLRVINESTAIALAYGIYKQDLPLETEPARIVAFLDVGHSCTQASLAAFNKGKLQMLGTTYDHDVGGLWFDAMIREHFRKEFLEKYKVDAAKNPRAMLRLLDESEKVKKQMSANATPIPLNIECFLDDKDVSGRMQRQEFEALCGPLFDRIQKLLQRLLEETKIKPNEIDSIEIVGGSSRIPLIRKIVNDIFGQEPKTTMNQDEAVCRGSAMQCAILSPSFRVRDFSMKDSQPFRIRLTWDGVGGGDGGESDVFVERDEFPFSKMLTFYRNEPFRLDAGYAFPNTIPHTTRQLGSWKILGVTPSGNGETRKIKIKVRVDPNGIFSVRSATMYDNQPVPEEPPKEEQTMEVDRKENEGKDASQSQNAEESKPKVKLVPIELQIEELVPTYNVQHFIEKEEEMKRVDLDEKAKADAKNAVEEYVYEMRNKLSDSLTDYVTPKDAEVFGSFLQSTEDWLYEDGEDAERKVYEDRLAELRQFGEPIIERYREAEQRQPAFDQFDQSIFRARKAYEEYTHGGPAHAHIESKDMEKVINAIEEKKLWLDDARSRTDKRSKTEAPVVFVVEIQQQRQAFESIVLPILNKPKPQPKKEETKEAPPPNPEKMPEASNGTGDNKEMEVD